MRRHTARRHDLSPAGVESLHLPLSPTHTDQVRLVRGSAKVPTREGLSEPTQRVPKVAWLNASQAAYYTTPRLGLALALAARGMVKSAV